MDTYIGFDSAWTDNSAAPGAICAVGIENDRPVRFETPQLASFDQALCFIPKTRSEDDATLIALDQPTVIPNLTGMRPVDRVAASLISWLGGGVQPANRGKRGMFCDDSPIWRFKRELGSEENPEQARVATNGLYLMEVFPALALPTLETGFYGRLRAPKYNPDRKKKFRTADWVRVAEAAARAAHMMGCKELAKWCNAAGQTDDPQKADQDKLDAVLCVLIAIYWRLRPREASLLLGDPDKGYMVLPASREVREYVMNPARKRSVAIDRAVPRGGPRSTSKRKRYPSNKLPGSAPGRYRITHSALA
ncbi:MAG: DUF429 domain-containing protein [Methylocystis sp.]